MLSMTGYGRGSAQLEHATLFVEARSVNHRFLDIRARFGGELACCTPVAEGIVRGTLRRGRIELFARLQGRDGHEVALDEDLAKSAWRALARLRDELTPGEKLPLSLLSAVPGLFHEPQVGDPERLRPSVEEATRRACEAVIEMRRAEGAALQRDLADRLRRVRDLVRAIEAEGPHLIENYRQRLAERVARLLAHSQLEPDQGRLEHEVVLFADRSDVAEELTRLASHSEQFSQLISQTPGDEPVGRKLDFLLQEMGREANTVGAKISDATITQHVVELKAELERMREQVQNVL